MYVSFRYNLSWWELIVSKLKVENDVGYATDDLQDCIWSTICARWGRRAWKWHGRSMKCEIIISHLCWGVWSPLPPLIDWPFSRLEGSCRLFSPPSATSQLPRKATPCRCMWAKNYCPQQLEKQMGESWHRVTGWHQKEQLQPCDFARLTEVLHDLGA